MPGGEAFWLAVRGNLETVTEAAQWLKVVEGPLAGVIQDASFCNAAEALLPPEPWDQSTWSAWTNAVKDATGAKGKALFLPLRLGLTGLEHGPELKTLLPLIGRDRASRRLRGQAA
jgi:glutamyl-tRNA synthetase